MELFKEYVDLVNFYDQNSSKPVTKTDLVPICELPEIFGLFGIQYQNKILAVGSKHLYTMQLSDGYYSISRDTHYHDLKKDVMLELPELISEPALVFYDFSEQQQIQNEKPSTLVFILDKEIQRTDTETRESTDETLVCYINEPLNPDDRMTILATAFTKSKLDNYINNLIRNNRLLYLNEKKLHTRDLSGIQLAKSATMPLTGASLGNIKNYRENVNEKRMKESGLFLKDIPDEEKTEHVCKTAILNNPLAFQYIPENRISQSLIFTLIEKQNRFSFKFIPEDKFLDGVHYYFRKTKNHKKRPDIIYKDLLRLMTEKQQTMFLTEINKEKEPSIEEATRYIVEHSNNNISMRASRIPSHVQSVSDSIMSFDKNPAGVLEIIGKRFEVGQDGKPTLEGFKALSRAMEIYSDKHYETARYLFIKDGQITRHVAVSSQTPASTIIKPADSFLYELKSYARETGSRIVFLHNHPSGYVEPSGADVELTDYLSNFFTDSDGTAYFSGHIILDHGTYGLWSQESKKWNALIDNSLQPISKIGETYKIQLSKYGKRVELEENGIATTSLMELSEFARECDAGNLWNTKDWVPGFLLTGNGIVTSFEQFGNFEFEDETVLCSKLKQLGRSYGSENIVLFPRSKEQFLMCERFAQDTGVVKDVYFENKDGIYELSQYNGGNIFNNTRIDEIKVDDTQNYEDEVLNKIKAEDSSRDNLKKIKGTAYDSSQVVADPMTEHSSPRNSDTKDFDKPVNEEDLSLYYERFKKETQNQNEEVQLQRALALSLDKNVSPLTEIKLNRTNWNMLFSKGTVESPIETIKLGENQFEKLSRSDRNNLLAAMYETLSNPSIVLEKETLDEKTGDFRPVNVYGKSFVREESNHKRIVESVIIFKDGENIPIGTHNKNIRDFVKQIKTADQVIYVDSEVSRVASLILQNGGSHVRLHDAVSNRVINSRYDKNNLLSMKDLQFSDEENIDVVREKSNVEKEDNVFYTKRVNKITNKENKLMEEERKSVFNYEVVESKDLSPEQDNQRTQYFDTLHWSDSVGELSAYNSINKFFDFFHHEDERLEFLKACSEVNLNDTYGDTNSVEQYLSHKFGMKTRFDEDWNPQIYEENKEFYDGINWIAQGIVKREEDIHSAILDGKTSITERKAGRLFENYGISNVSDLEDYVSKNLLHKDIEQEVEQDVEEEIVDSGIESVQENRGLSEERNSVFNQNVVETKDLSPEQKKLRDEYFHLNFEPGTFGELKSIENFFDFYNHEDERIEFYKACKEVDFQDLQGSRHATEQYLCHKFGMKSRWDKDWSTEIYNSNTKFYKDIMDISLGIVRREKEIHDAIEFGATSETERKAGFLFEKFGISSVSELENYVSNNLLHKDIKQEVEQKVEEEIVDRGIESVQKNRGMSEAAIEEDILSQENPHGLSYGFDEEKDFELMSDISDVLAEGEVFTKRNENIDGEIKVKLGDLFDKNEPEKLQPSGLRHLIKHRMEERLNDGLSVEEAQKETSAILFLAINNIDKAPAVKEPNGRYAVYNDGIKTTIGKDKNGKFIVTGFDFDDTKKEAVDAIMSVNAHYEYTPEFLDMYAQVGATYASLTNNIAQQNSPVNEKERPAAEFQNKEFEQLKSSFESLQEKLNDVLKQNNELRKENEMLRNQQSVSDEKSANESISQNNKKQEMSDSQRSQGGRVDTSFNRETAFRSNTKVPAFGHYNEKTEKIEIIKNAVFERKIEDEYDNSMNKIVLAIPHENGEHTQLVITEREYNKMINAVEKLEEVKRTISDDTWDWTKAHQDYNEVMQLDEKMYRLNTSGNFLHNFRVHCIREVHNPEDAMKIAALMVQDMTPHDKKEFNKMRKDYDSQYGKGAYDRLLLQEFEKVSEEKKISPELLQSDFTNGFTILKGMNRELNELKKGQEINGTHIKVGDTIPLSLKCKSMDGKRIIIPLADYKIEKVTQNMIPNRAVLVNTKTNAIEMMPLNDLVTHIQKVEKQRTKEVNKEMKKQHREYGYEGR